jgi:putative transposase
MANHPTLSLVRQCQLLGIGRSSFYYESQVSSDEELRILKLLDEQYLKTPCYGSRKMLQFLREQGYPVNRKRVQRLMRKLGIEAIYCKPHLSLPHPEHRVYPYLLRNLAINRANQVWSTDITYLPVLRGHFYLVAVMDWWSRKVLSWRISNSLDVAFCIEALQAALAEYGSPEIFNSDQGSQFTSIEFTDCLRAAEVSISMDGRGRYQDNIFIERLWRSIKYELIYLNEFKNGMELQSKVRQWMDWYNEERYHQALDYKTPNQVYYDEREDRN